MGDYTRFEMYGFLSYKLKRVVLAVSMMFSEETAPLAHGYWTIPATSQEHSNH